MHTCAIGKDCVKDIPIEEVSRAIEKMLNRKKNIQQIWWRGKVYKKLARGILNGSGTGGYRV